MKKYLVKFLLIILTISSVANATPAEDEHTAFMAQKQFMAVKENYGNELMALYGDEVDTYVKEISDLLMQSYDEIKTQPLRYEDLANTHFGKAITNKIPAIVNGLSPQKQYVLNRKLIENNSIYQGSPTYKGYFIMPALVFAMADIAEGGGFTKLAIGSLSNRLANFLFSATGAQQVGLMAADIIIWALIIRYTLSDFTSTDENTRVNLQSFSYYESQNKMAEKNDILLTELTRKKYYRAMVKK